MLESPGANVPCNSSPTSYRPSLVVQQWLNGLNGLLNGLSEGKTNLCRDRRPAQAFFFSPPEIDSSLLLLGAFGCLVLDYFSIWLFRLLYTIHIPVAGPPNPPHPGSNFFLFAAGKWGQQAMEQVVGMDRNIAFTG